MRKLAFGFILGLGCIKVVFAATVPASAAASYTPDQQSVIAAAENWQQAIDARNPNAIAALYDQDAHFYPTFVNAINSDPKALHQYFVNLTQKPQLQVIYDQENPRVYGDGTVAVNSGLYTFSYLGPNKHTVQVHARFTFVYVKENGQWMIVEHQSSVLPQKAKSTSGF